MQLKFSDLFKKLCDVFEQHDNIIIALDFDDTIFDWKSNGYTVDYVIDLVIRCQNFLNAKVILFTCREGLELSAAIDYCKDNGIGLHGVNRNPDHPVTKSKPYFNVLLDDKACLPEVCSILERVLSEYVEAEIDSADIF